MKYIFLLLFMVSCTIEHAPITYSPYAKQKRASLVIKYNERIYKSKVDSKRLSLIKQGNKNGTNFYKR